MLPAGIEPATLAFHNGAIEHNRSYKHHALPTELREQGLSTQVLRRAKRAEVPPMGIEPTTYSFLVVIQNWCSTTEL